MYHKSKLINILLLLILLVFNYTIESVAKLTVNSILYKTGNLRRCSHNFMKNFSSVGESGIVCDNGLFSSAKKIVLFYWKVYRFARFHIKMLHKIEIFSIYLFLM